MEMLTDTRGPRRFGTTDAADPLDLWKVHGTPITSPAQLCMIELVRKQCAGAEQLAATGGVFKSAFRSRCRGATSVNCRPDSLLSGL